MNTSVSGMATYQTAIAVSSENVANADADGYTRQSVLIISGPEVADVRRVYDTFCAKKVLESNEDQGRYETAAKYMAYVEAVFDESSGYGISASLNEFWNGWSELVNDPSDMAARADLVARAESLAGYINQAALSLDDIQKEVEGEISNTVEEINDLTAKIAALNRDIAYAEARGHNTNSLLDQVESLTGQLAELVDIQVQTNDSGQVNVQLSGGRSLVSGSTSREMGTSIDAATGLLNVTWQDGSGGEVDVTGQIKGGVLAGCLDVRDEYIAAYKQSLDDLAGTLINEVNALLLSGYDLNGSAGVELFLGAGADDISVNPLISDDPSLIAAGSAGPAVGDGTIAEGIAALSDALLCGGGSSTMGDNYAALVTRVGSDVRSISDFSEYYAGLADFYADCRESVSGVSLDEETARLVLYQQGYEACARVIEILQEIMDTAINM